MSKRTKITQDIIEQPELLQEQTETSPEQAEITETVEEQAELDIAIQQHYNANATIERIADEIEALQRRLDEINEQAAQAKKRAEQAAQSCVFAEQRIEQCSDRLLKARTRAMVATGTSEEAEKQAELDAATRYLELAQLGREEAVKGFEDAVRTHEQVTSGQSILSEIERCKTEISEKLLLKQEFEALEAEAWQRVGREKARLISARLDELQREINEREASLAEAKLAIDAELAKIDDLRGHPQLYYDLRKQYIPEQLPQRMPTPRERVIDAYIDYLEILRDHGSSLQFFDHKSKMLFCNSLDLNPSMMQAFLGYDYAFKQGRVDIAKALLRRSDI